MLKGILHHSAMNREKIVIFYMDGKGRVTERFIRVIRYSDTQVIAYCFFRKKMRTFRMENILSAGRNRKGVGA